MTMHDSVTRRRFLKTGAAAAAAGALTSLHAGESQAKDRWQIGCYTRPWASLAWPAALDAIAEAGFTYAGLMTTVPPRRLVISAATPVEEAQRVGEEARKRGLKILSVYGGGIGAGASLERGIADLKRLIDNCAAARAASLLMGGIGKKEHYEPYYKAIAACCDYAAERKVAITVKPHGGLNATGPQCRKAVELVGHRNFTLWYDPGNIYYYSNGTLDPVEDAATVQGIVTGMCVKDYQHPKNVAVTPGTGMVDFPRVLAVLKNGGFTRGPLVIETLARGDPDATIREAKKARTFLESLVA
jgi:sugar phosphate isomerase/epimerase